MDEGEMSLNLLAHRIRVICDKHEFLWDMANPKDVATCLLLMHSEVSEACESLRDQKYTELCFEVVDCIIRGLHLLNMLECDVDAVMNEKLSDIDAVINGKRSVKHTSIQPRESDT